MKRVLGIVTVLMLISVCGAAEEHQDRRDTRAIRATVNNYVQGWFTSNTGRMRRALHPNLFKCTIDSVGEENHEVLGAMTAEQLIAYTAVNGHGDSDTEHQGDMEIIYQDDKFAVVHIISEGFYDICNLVKLNGRWKIIQVLWATN